MNQIMTAIKQGTEHPFFPRFQKNAQRVTDAQSRKTLELTGRHQAPFVFTESKTRTLLKRLVGVR